MIRRIRRAFAGLRRGWRGGPEGDPRIPAAPVLATSALLSGASQAGQSGPELERLLRAVQDSKRRAGLIDSDPMTPLIDTQVQLVAHLCRSSQAGLQSDHDLKTLLGRVVPLIERLIAMVSWLSRELGDTQNALQNWQGARPERGRAVRWEGWDLVIRPSVALVSVVAVGLALVLVVFITRASAMAEGLAAGRATVLAEVQEIDDGLRSAFHQGPLAARDWLSLMRWNPLGQALANCKGEAVVLQGDRRYCKIPLWIEAALPETDPPSLVPVGPETSGRPKTPPPPPPEESGFERFLRPPPPGPVQFGPARR